MISSRPNSACAPLTNRRLSASRVTSISIASARPPEALISPTAVSSRSRRRAPRTTATPSRASRLAQASPIPDEAPVIAATRLLSDDIWWSVSSDCTSTALLRPEDRGRNVMTRPVHRMRRVANDTMMSGGENSAPETTSSAPSGGAAHMSSEPVIALLRNLVAIDSVNPSLVPGAAGEGEIAAAVAASMRQIGMDVEVDEVAPGRPNVVGVSKGGQRAGRSCCAVTPTR